MFDLKENELRRFWDKYDIGKGIFRSYVDFVIEERKGTMDSTVCLELRDNLYGDGQENTGLVGSLKTLWPDPILNPYAYKDKGVLHSERVIRHIEAFLFYQMRNGNESEYESHCNLTIAEIWILLYAAYLHDIGKLMWQLLYDHSNYSRYTTLIGTNQEVKKLFSNKPSFCDMTSKQRAATERFHTETLDVVFGKYLNSGSHNDAESCINSLTPVGFLPEIHKLREFKVSPRGKVLRSGSANKTNLLQYIRLVSIRHESKNLLDLKDRKHVRLKLLASLLIMGDCCDTDRGRITDRQGLARHLRAPASVEGSKTLSYWLMFYFAKVNVISKQLSVRIEITYEIPKVIGKETFLWIRSFIERDFHEPQFLDVIQEAFRTEIKHRKEAGIISTNREETIPIELRYFVKPTDGMKIDICSNDDSKKGKEREEEELEPEIVHQMPRHLGRVLPDLKKRVKELGEEEKDLAFVRVPKNRYKWMVSRLVGSADAFLIPTEPSILFLLTLFDNYPDAHLSVTELMNGTGIKDEKKTLQNCTVLAKWGVIKPVTRDAEDIAYKFNGPDEKLREQIRLLLEEYRVNPLGIKTNIHEFEVLERILPFSRSPRESLVITGIGGLDEKVLRDPSIPATKGGFLPNRCILVEGAPGTGKTTFGMQVLYANKDSRNVAFLTFEEGKSQLMDDFRGFGWHDEDVLIPLTGLTERLNRQEIRESGGAERQSSAEVKNIVNTLIEKVDDKDAEIIVIDSISRFRELADNQNVCRQILRDFFSILKIRGITVFCLGEKGDRGERDGGQDRFYKYEAYLADGIIRLTCEVGNRFLEIVKLRGQYYAKGKHRFDIRNEEGILKAKDELKIGWLSKGINLFPNLEAYSFHERAPEAPGKRRDDSESYLRSGIPHLDELLPAQEGGKGGFMKGDSVLVLGSPGTGKTLLGLYFLMGGRKAKETSENNTSTIQTNQGHRGDEVGNREKKPEMEPSLWISFEGDRGHLIKSANGFNPDTVPLLEVVKDEINFSFHYFPLAKLNHEELIFAIMEEVDDKQVERLVIDCISDLESIFPDRLEFKNYVLSLVRLLSEKGVTTMLLYRVPKFFGSYERPGIEITSIVDTIVSLKNFDISNRMKKGLFVLKVRGREHRSDLQTVEITRDGGLEVSAKGWTLEGLLSGEAVQIKEPPIFFKLFYENEAERTINDKIIEEFNEIRYNPEDKFFTSIRKPHLYTEFWSFRGYYGAGHANIRVISLPSYSALAFRDKHQLHDLTDFFADRVKKDIEAIDAWKHLAIDAGDGKRKYDMVPNYADFGFLCYQTEYLKHKEMERLVNSQDVLTWDALIGLVKQIVETEGGDEKIAGFALPYLFDIADFVAFFLEILWAYGGEVVKDERLDEASQLMIAENPAKQALRFLNDLVFEHGVAKNPYHGDFSTGAVFSRKRYSSIRTLDERMRGSSSQNVKPVGILNLPRAIPEIPSYSVCDIYTLGVVREALSPEIGWIFVDSLTHPEWVRNKAQERVGFPIKTEDRKNPDIYDTDPNAYEAVEKILDDPERKYRYRNRGDIPHFYGIERILHDEIKKLFIPEERENLLKAAGGGLNQAIENTLTAARTRIIEELKLK